MTSVALHEIVFDNEIYPRATWSQTTVDRYADAMLAGETFPPIILESGTNRLLDGMHRTEAFRAVGKDLVGVDYHEIPDGVPAKLYAASLSSRHGDPLAGDDKRQTARETIQANPDYSLVFIASYLGISRQTVSKYVGDLVERRRIVRKAKAALLSRAGKSVREIADELGVSKSEVSRNVADDIPGQLTEELLREAAADLPVDDAEELVAAILAERTRPTQSPGPADTTTSPTDPGTTPAPATESTTAPAVPPQEPDLAADVVRVLALAGEPGMTVVEIWCKMPGGIRSSAVQTAVDALAEAGRVEPAGRALRGNRMEPRWLLAEETPEPDAVLSTAPSGSGRVEAAESGEQYKADPAERIAAVAEAAPEFVKPVAAPPASPQALTYAARQSAKRIVARLRSDVEVIIAGVDVGEQLVTEQMIADLQAAVDRLASRLEVSA